MYPINSFLFVVVVLCIIYGQGQILQFGLCPDVVTVKYFELEKFLGKWYEIQRYPIWYEENGSCAYKRIQQCGRNIEIEHVFVRDEIQYVLHVRSRYNPGDEAVFNITQNNVDSIGIPLSIIATDYKNYAVVFGCLHHDELNLKYVAAWILSRNRSLSSENITEAYDTIGSIPGSSTAYLEDVEQDEIKCEYHWTAHVQAVNTTDRGDFLQNFIQ